MAVADTSGRMASATSTQREHGGTITGEASCGGDLSLLTQDACDLVGWCVERGIIEPPDRRWAYNRILECLGAYGPAPVADFGAETSTAFDLDASLARLAETGIANGQAEDSTTGRDRLAMRLMGSVMPRPSEVAKHFFELYHSGAEGPRAATDWFYALSCDVNYVRRSAIARNLAWTTPTRWGKLEITINKSKPEKDPRDIAAAGRSAAGASYPACALCRENEGYSGRPAAVGGGHPARQNLRIIPIELGGEEWGLQYSPYAYYPEHCIVMSSIHRPMHVDVENMGRLLDFVDLFPHYFVGSNADLPIVGGSILSHDHFQGGRHTHPMVLAPCTERFELAAYPQVSCGVLQWPLSVLRLRSADRAQLLACAGHILDAWRSWTDESVGIIAHDADGTPHNTITPICRRRDEVDVPAWELDLALRCNICDEAHPLGVFHPHAELHHIKKENIGLIEVMGEAILPARLEGELAATARHLLEGDDEALASDPLSAAHAPWARQVALRHPELSADTWKSIMRDEVGLVFARVLEDAGVFKWDEEGRAALHRFLDSL